MNNPSISLRFGIILEAYCRGISGHLKGLIRQVEALDKLTKLTDALKVKKDDPLKVTFYFIQIEPTAYYMSVFYRIV